MIRPITSTPASRYAARRWFGVGASAYPVVYPIRWLGVSPQVLIGPSGPRYMTDIDYPTIVLNTNKRRGTRR